MTRKPRRSKSTKARSQSELGSPREEAPETALDDKSAKDASEKAQAPAEDQSTSGDKAADAGADAGTGADVSTDANEAKASDVDRGKKLTLPAFGFAKDLLKKPPEDAPPVEPEPILEASDIDQADPGRIFAFADSLERNAADLEPKAAPVRLETWVTFSLAGETFALPVEPVREVVRVASITRVPHAPKPIRGVTNMRGRVIPVIDLRLRIDLPQADLERASRVIVVSSRGRLLGLLVDAVDQVIHIDLAKAQSPPDDVMTAQSDYISGVYHMEDQLILLLDIDRALVIHETPHVDIANTTSSTHLATKVDETTAGLS